MLCRRVSLMVVSAAAARTVASRAVVENVPRATQFATLGVEVTRDEVAKAHCVPLSVLDKAVNPAQAVFTAMDMARAKFAPLIATSKEGDNLVGLREATRRCGLPLTPVAGAKEKFKTTPWKSLKELMTFYETVMYPILAAHAQFTSTELSSFHTSDDLKRGLAAFGQDVLEKKKAELEGLKKAMAQQREFIRKASEEAFDTPLLNDIANVLRVAGECNPDAHRMALQVLDDMTMMGIPFNAQTSQILRSTLFDDGPFDHSALLFNVIQYPERGEISIEDAPLEKIADNVLKTISTRHKTPLDDGVLLRQGDTNPNLPWSAE